jgi:flavin-dependent dehydrogenase
MYDAIVVGARCAGSPTSMLLARKGYRVLLVDRDTFPSDTFRNHFIHNTTIARLNRWGLLDRLVATGVPPIIKFTFDVGPFALVGSPEPVDGFVECYAPRRTVFDKMLLDAASEAGVEVREGFTVDEILKDGDRVDGIRGHGRGGSAVSEEAPIVIGADGQYSTVARAVGAETYNEIPALACWYYSYYEGMDLDGVELYVRPGNAVIAFPTHDNRVVAGATWPQARMQEIRSDIEGNLNRAFQVSPSFAERMGAARRAEDFKGAVDMVNFYRKPFGPGWALIGDAGYHKDPILGQGITDALRDAETLTAAIDSGLSGRQEMMDALAGYQRTRDETVGPMYQFNCQLAQLAEPPPEIQQLFGAMRNNPEAISQFFGVITDAVPVQTFFAPENMQRIITAAAPAA